MSMLRCQVDLFCGGGEMGKEMRDEGMKQRERKGRDKGMKQREGATDDEGDEAARGRGGLSSERECIEIAPRGIFGGCGVVEKSAQKELSGVGGICRRLFFNHLLDLISILF